jgi:hypothetical protein
VADRVYALTVRANDSIIGDWVSTFHYSQPTADTVGPDALCSGWWTALHTDLTNVSPNTSTFVEVHAREAWDGSGIPGAPKVGSYFPNVAGTRSGDDKIDGALCARATLHTGIGGKRRRGGLYSPPCMDTAALAANGKFLAASGFWNYWLAWMASLLTHQTLVISSSDFVWCVFSRKEAETAGNPEADITGYITDVNKQYWLRRRERRLQ